MENKNKHDDATSFAGAMAGSELASTEAAASDELRKGMERFLDASDSKVKPPWLKGNLFEYIEAAKFNADAARKGVDLEAVVTAADGRPQDETDIEIIRKSDGTIVDKVQAKAGGRNYEAYGLSHPRNDGMTKLVPKDHVERVKETGHWVSKPDDPRNYRNTAASVTGELKREGASSRGTWYDELEGATKNPKSYASRLELGQAGREIAVTAGSAAAAGAVMGGAMSLVRKRRCLREG